MEAEEARAAYQRRVVEKSNVAQSILSKMSIWKWQCDTPAFEHAENETYIQFKELLQVKIKILPLEFCNFIQITAIRNLNFLITRFRYNFFYHFLFINRVI